MPTGMSLQESGCVGRISIAWASDALPQAKITKKPKNQKFRKKQQLNPLFHYLKRLRLIWNLHVLYMYDMV